jgi:hypothetical protein
MTAGSMRRLPCWIEGFVEFTEGLDLPPNLRLWTAISTLSGLLERRVWTSTKRGQVFPNFFILLVTPPGIGKSLVLRPAQRILKDTKTVHVAPDNMTKASLMDELQESLRTQLTPQGLMEYHSMTIVAPEFGVFCPAHDMEFLSVLCKLYDCDDSHRESRRGMKGEQIDISNPHINLIAGSQPDYLSQFLPEVAWGQGYMARTIIVYSETIHDNDLFSTNVFPNSLKSSLHDDALDILKMLGQMEWSEGAKDVIRAWQKTGMAPVPQHFKLKHYNTRRILNVLKLSCVSAASTSSNMIIKPEDAERAIFWLTSNEKSMAEIFTAMKGNSDYNVLQELQMYVVGESVRLKGKDLPESFLIGFLSGRTTGQNVLRLLELAERSRLIERVVTPSGVMKYRPGPGQLDPET